MALAAASASERKHEKILRMKGQQITRQRSGAKPMNFMRRDSRLPGDRRRGIYCATN
jgi:hypothetical protein